MSEPRTPEASDFPKDITVSIVAPQNEKKASSNILILLHGLGDSHAPFAALGMNMSLPETTCVAVRAPEPLPFANDGFHWGDDLIFDSSTGGLDMESEFTKTHNLLKRVVDDVLIGNCGWKRRAVFFFGFGQGGLVALDVASRLSAKEADSEFGGVVSIGGPLPTSAPSPAQKAKTPVILLGAEKNSAINESAEARARNVFDSVQVVHWKGRKQDGIMKTPDEVRPIMEFFARRLRSRAGIPAGTVELSS